MVTTRCKSNNLLNHIKQKNIDCNVTYEYCTDRWSTNYLNWIGTFHFNGNTYTGVGRSKQKAVENFMSYAEEEVYNFITNVKRE